MAIVYTFMALYIFFVITEFVSKGVRKMYEAYTFRSFWNKKACEAKTEYDDLMSRLMTQSV